MLITNQGSLFLDIFRNALRSAATVRIAAGYVSQEALAIADLASVADTADIRIVIGRAIPDGLPRPTLTSLRQEWDPLFRHASSTGGIRAHSGFHSKLYSITDRMGITRCWMGSSNFTTNGLRAWREAMIEIQEPALLAAAIAEIEDLYANATDITIADIQAISCTRTSSVPRKGKRLEALYDAPIVIAEEPGSTQGSNGFLLPLIDPRTGEVQSNSGLNWQRRSRSRRSGAYEACIAIPATARGAVETTLGSNSRGTRFVALTPDGQRLQLSLQGTATSAGLKYAKQISGAGTGGTQVIGHWLLRDVLGLRAHKTVTRADLERFGRIDIGFVRIGNDASGLPLVALDF